jgi:hypothetical protein
LSWISKTKILDETVISEVLVEIRSEVTSSRELSSEIIPTPPTTTTTSHTHNSTPQILFNFFEVPSTKQFKGHVLRREIPHEWKLKWKMGRYAPYTKLSMAHDPDNIGLGVFGDEYVPADDLLYPFGKVMETFHASLGLGGLIFMIPLIHHNERDINVLKNCWFQLLRDVRIHGIPILILCVEYGKSTNNNQISSSSAVTGSPLNMNDVFDILRINQLSHASNRLFWVKKISLETGSGVLEAIDWIKHKARLYVFEDINNNNN